MVQVPGIKPAKPDQDMRLHRAARSGAVDEIKRLLEEGVPIDSVDARGVTPLVYAAMTGNLESVKLLIRAGADPDTEDDLGYSAYKAAMFYGDFRGVTMPPYDKVLKFLKKFER